MRSLNGVWTSATTLRYSLAINIPGREFSNYINVSDFHLFSLSLCGLRGVNTALSCLQTLLLTLFKSIMFHSPCFCIFPTKQSTVQTIYSHFKLPPTKSRSFQAYMMKTGEYLLQWCPRLIKVLERYKEGDLSLRKPKREGWSHWSKYIFSADKGVAGVFIHFEIDLYFKMLNIDV